MSKVQVLVEAGANTNAKESEVSMCVHTRVCARSRHMFFGVSGAFWFYYCYVQ